MRCKREKQFFFIQTFIFLYNNFFALKLLINDVVCALMKMKIFHVQNEVDEMFGKFIYLLNNFVSFN